jgi:hypothetical protein
MFTTFFALPTPNAGQDNVIAVATAELGKAGVKVWKRGVFIMRAPAVAQYTKLSVPVTNPVKVTVTARPTVAPLPVIEKPDRKFVRPSGAGKEAEATAFATTPDVAVIGVAPTGYADI